jgi:hypothetical protein
MILTPEGLDDLEDQGRVVFRAPSGKSEDEDELEDDCDFGTSARKENVGLEGRLYVDSIEVGNE